MPTRKQREKAERLLATFDWSKVDAFKPYGGIRIEDDVVCTEDAPLNLTRETWSETA